MVAGCLPEIRPAVVPAMPVGSVAGLLEGLQKTRLLEPVQFDEVTRSLCGRFSDPRALAGELIQRGWLTPYQANLLLQGRGDELLLGSFLVMEYVEGIDLAKQVRLCGPLPIEQAVAYVRQAALGLQHAHERGLVHRDMGFFSGRPGAGDRA
jgi:serine/threonine protein kinase